jgi:hypothetical protein
LLVEWKSSGTDEFAQSEYWNRKCEVTHIKSHGKSTIAPETLQVGSHGKNRCSGKLQQNYSTRIKKELVDKPPTGPHLQREPQIVQSEYCIQNFAASQILTQSQLWQKWLWRNATPSQFRYLALHVIINLGSPWP